MTNILLKQDLIAMTMRQPNRTEAEILAGRIVDLIYDAAQEITENILTEHCSAFNHAYGEGY